MQSRPTLNELLEAVRELLTAEVIPTIQEGGLRFKALIAANILAIGERELASGETAMDVELARLRNLLSNNDDTPLTVNDKRAAILVANRHLAQRIRSGDADGGKFGAAVRDHVRQTLIDQLMVSNPKFLAKFKPKD
jgi:hypothetical protein